MNNYYQQENRFVLIDVEGVVLSPGAGLIVREPINVDSTRIKFKRNLDTHGMDFEFIDAKRPFGFSRVKFPGATHSGYSLIEQIYNAKGIDGKCQFKIMSRRNNFNYNIKRKAGDDKNIESIVGFLRLLGDFTKIKVGDRFTISGTSSVYEGETYTALSVVYDLPTLPGITVIDVYESVPNSNYQGDFNIHVEPVFETPYAGDLHFGKVIFKDEQVDILSRRVNLGDKFRTRIGTPVELETTETLDGESMNAIVWANMFLHSKAIQISQKAKSTSGLGLGVEDVVEVYSQQDHGSPKTTVISDPGLSDYNNSLLRQYGQDVITDVLEFTSLEDITPHLIFTKERGRLVIDWSAEIRLVVTNMNAQNIEYLGTFIEIDGVVTQVNGAQTFAVNNAFFVCEVDFSYQGDFNIQKGSSVRIYDRWQLYNSGGVNQTARMTVGENNVMEMTFDAFADNSTSRVYSLEEAFRHVLEAITGNDGTLSSEFLSQKADRTYISNGYLIRGFNPSERSPVVSFQELFQGFAQPVFGLGYAILDNNGTAQILIERYDRFYQQKEIVAIDEIHSGSWRYESFADIHYNEIEIGFTEYPKSTDENKKNNIDEFNTKHQLITPVETEKRKLSMLSGFIASGYKIENQRREQFNEVPKDTVSDDDKIFAILGTNTISYQVKRLSTDPTNNISSDDDGFIFLQGTYFDIRVNDVITLNTVNASVYDGNSYTIEEIDLLGQKTRIKVTESTSNAGYSGDWSLTLPASRLRASRNEEFDQVNNIISPDTAYNIGLNPKYMLVNHSLLINSGLSKKLSTQEIKTQRAFLNKDMSAQFNAADGDYTLAGLNQLLSMSGAIQIQDMNGGLKLFTGSIIKFTAQMSYETVMYIRDAYLNINHNQSYGYIRVTDPFGVDKFGYLFDMTYNPLSNEVQMTLIEKSSDVFVVTEYEHELIIGFASENDACGASGAGTTYYSNTETLVVGSVIYTDSGDTGTTLSDGWVYDVANNRPIRMQSGSIAEIGSTCATPPSNKTASSEFINEIPGGTINTAVFQIEGLNYGESNQTGINIGTDGTSIIVSLEVEQADLDAALGDEVGVTLALYDGTSDNDPQIGTLLSDSVFAPGTAQVNALVSDGQITSGQLYIKATKANIVPI